MKVKTILSFAAIIFIIGLLAVNYDSNPKTTDVASTNPNISIDVKLNGFLESTKPVANMKDADNRYYVEISVIDHKDLSESDISILDQQNHEQTILTFDSKSDENYTLWFAGKPDTKYKFVYEDDYSNIKEDTVFTTPSNKTNLSEVEKTGKVVLKQSMKERIKENLLQNLDNNWGNIAIYYTPTDKEKKAIAQAYWEAFIKDWYDTYQLQLSFVNDSYYDFEILYKWAPPDIDALNRKIDEREDQLKKEFKNNPKKVYQTIISELPTMIKETSKLDEIEGKADFSISRERFSSDDSYSDLSISDLYTLTDPLSEIYP